MHTVKELPVEDRPREKLIMRGAQSLSDSELIAILLRIGKKGKSVIEMSRELLKKSNNLASLATMTVASFQQIDGIGKDKAATLAAAFEISRRILFQSKWQIDKVIKSPKEIADLFIPILRDEQVETFWVVCLNSCNKIIKYEKISSGNLNSSVVHPREVFKVAIENNSANIILIHNHPSGNKKPSNSDIQITKQIVQAGKIIDIQVFDHLIIAENSYTSFSEEKLL